MENILRHFIFLISTMIEKVKFVVIYLAISLAKSEAQLSNILFKPAYNVLNALSGNIENNNEFSQQTSNYHQAPNYQSIPNHGSNYQPQSNYQSSSTACGGYWSYQNDYSGKSGLITIPNPSYTQNELKVSLTIPVQLNSVS